MSDLISAEVCDSCVGQLHVSSYCLQCHANICDKCKSTHCDTRLTRDHLILHQSHPEVTKARRSKKIYCPQHIGKEYITYCTRCSKPCCATCIIQTHEGHKFCDLEQLITETEAEVAELVQTLERDFIPLNRKSILKVEEHINVYKKSKDEIIQCVKGKIRGLQQHLENGSKTFLAHVDDLGKKDLNEMESKKLELEANLEKVKEIAAKGKVAPVDASLLFMKEDLQISKVTPLRPNEINYPGNLSFKTSTFQLPHAFDLIGNISNKSRKPISDTSDPLHSQDIQNKKHPYEKVKVITTIADIEGRTVLFQTNGKIWIYDGNKKNIGIYNERFARERTMYRGFKCDDMARYGSQDVIATNWIDKIIVLVSDSVDLTKLCKGLELTPCGLCFNEKQEIVVGAGIVREVNGIIGLGSWRLIVYSSDASSVLQEIRYDQSGKDVFMGPITRIRQAFSGEYIVADGTRIVCLTQEWNIKWKNEFGPNYNVLALCCDKHDNIIVGDRDKNVIVVLDKSGQLVHTLLTKEDGIFCPWSMDIDDKGQLWIGQEENVLIVFLFEEC